MRLVSLILALSLAAAAAPSQSELPLTVVLDFEHGSNVPLKTVHTELQKLLSGAHVAVDLRLRSELPEYPQLGQVVMFKMRGVCSADASIPVDALSDERGALAMTYTSDGQILPFGEVECDRLRKSLGRIWGEPLGEQHSRDLGIAIARVMAHEIYHILGDSAEHTKSGVTKARLTSRELVQPELNFPKAADDAVDGKTHPR